MTGRGLRILMVTPRSPLAAGGVERYVWEVSSRLAARGAHVEILCSDPGGRESGHRLHDGLLIRSVRAWPANRDWYFAPAIWSEIEPGAWDVVHVQSYHTLVAPLAMLRALSLRTPYCVTFHSGGHSSSLRNRSRPLQRRLLRPLLVRADALVAIARFEVDLYSQALGIPRSRFHLIPVGTDLKLSPDATTANGDGGALLASIGRLERYKGHQHVIAALPYVLESLPDARLVVVGTGPHEPALRTLATELGVGGRVEFTSVRAGDTDGMAGLLSGVALVVLMSEHETHPQVALEAAAARRRLLVADDGAGLRELARDGLADIVAHNSSPRALAHAILGALAKPPPSVRPQLASWDECVERLLALYATIAGSRSR